MRLLTVEQAQAADQLAQSQYGLSPEQLMESAGDAVCEEIHHFGIEKKRKILILIGPGNNGADGFVIARFLKRKGFQQVRCQVVVTPKSPSRQWSLQKQKAIDAGAQMLQHSVEHLQVEISESDLIVDALFGVGFHGSLPDNVVQLIQFINTKKTRVMAVDVPTGLDLRTGLETPVALRADVTVTFGLAKPGFFVLRGPRCTGQIRVHPIGLPEELLRLQASTHFAWGAKASQSALPGREDSSYKGDHGSVYVVAGSNDYPGAGVLVSMAAGRAGAGYTYLVGTDVYKQVRLAPEVIFREREKFKLSEIEKKKSENTVFVVGPGLGVGKETADFIRDLKKRNFKNVVLDADALTVCATEKLHPLPSTWILTPHVGEAARLLGCTTKSLSKDRFKIALQVAQKYGCVVLFKGFRTVVSDGQRAVVVLSGNAALGKAGSGDVLSGFIGAFRGQGLGPMKAACLGAYVHGHVADEWIREGKDVLSLVPSDLFERVPELLKKIRMNIRFQIRN
jgi:hydroxyethylthiazole kinase-like uncharacterized protein yjeF